MEKPVKDMTDQELDEYLSSNGVSGVGIPDKILNESADVAVKDRLLLKNFGGSTPDQLAYLQTKYPDRSIKTDPEGEIIIKSPGETAYKKLDANWLGSKPANWVPELLKDVGDVAYDTVSGGAQGFATGTAGVAGALGGGVGALPAAMAVGSASGAGLELLRQGLGNAFGVSKGVDRGNIASSAAFGAASPFIFGTGATAAMKSAGLTPDKVRSVLESSGLGYVAKDKLPTLAETALARDFVDQAQGGVVKTLPRKALALFSQTPEETLAASPKLASESLKKTLIENGLKIDPNGDQTLLDLTAPVGNQRGGVESFLDSVDSQIFETLENKRRESGEEISMLLSQSAKTMDVAKYKIPFEKKIEELQKQLDVNPIPSIKERLDEYKSFVSKYLTKAATAEDKEAGTVVRAGMRNAGTADEAYAPLEVPVLTAFNLQKSMADFVDYNQSASSVQRMSGLSRELRADAAAAEKAMSDDLYEKIGGTGAQELYRKNRELYRDLAKKFSTPESGMRIIQNINSRSNTLVRRQLQAFDADHKTNLLEMASLADLTKRYANPDLLPLSEDTRTSTGKAVTGGGMGAILGYVAGLASGVPMMPQILSGVGLGTGAIASGPAFSKKAMQMSQGVRRGARNINKAATPYIDNFMNSVSPAIPSVPDSLRALNPGQSGLIYSAWNALGRDR